MVWWRLITDDEHKPEDFTHDEREQVAQAIKQGFTSAVLDTVSEIIKESKSECVPVPWFDPNLELDAGGRAINIKIVWGLEDIRQQAETHEIKLTEEEEDMVLELMYDKHDNNVGINWDTIDTYISHVVGER